MALAKGGVVNIDGVEIFYKITISYYLRYFQIYLEVRIGSK
jgi:hypothetical protein